MRTWSNATDHDAPRCTSMPGAAVRLRRYLWRFPINQGEPWGTKKGGGLWLTTLAFELTKWWENLAMFCCSCWSGLSSWLQADVSRNCRGLRKSIAANVVWLPATHFHPIPHVSGEIAHIGLCRGQDRLVGATNGWHQKCLYYVCSMPSLAMIDLTTHPSSDASKVRRSRLTWSILDQSSTVSLLKEYLKMIFGYSPTTIDVLPPVGSFRRRPGNA